MAAGKKKIELKQFLRDIEGGMHQPSLMAKYALSPGELSRAIKTLEERGLLKQLTAPLSVPAATGRLQPHFECPSCGAIHHESFDECPTCGIVLSKVRAQDPTSESYYLRKEKRGAALQDHPAMPMLGYKYFFHIIGMVVLMVVLIGVFLVLRWVKSTQNLALARNVQAVLTASSSSSKPDYSHLAQMFGNSTGSMAAVMESRRTPLNEKMHELYQKLVYLGELQTRMRFRGPSRPTGIGGYRQAMDAADRSKGPINSELDNLRQGLTTERRSLPEAGEAESPSGSRSMPGSSPGITPAVRMPDEEGDSTGALFVKGEEELRSLCEQVLRMLNIR